MSAMMQRPAPIVNVMMRSADLARFGPEIRKRCDAHADLPTVILRGSPMTGTGTRASSPRWHRGARDPPARAAICGRAGAGSDALAPDTPALANVQDGASRRASASLNRESACGAWGIDLLSLTLPCLTQFWHVCSRIDMRMIRIPL